MDSPLLTTDAPDAAQTAALVGGATLTVTAAFTLAACALRGGSRKEACVEAATAPLEATNKLSVGDRLLKVEKEKEELEKEKKAAGVAHAREKEAWEEKEEAMQKKLAKLEKQNAALEEEIEEWASEKKKARRQEEDEYDGHGELMKRESGVQFSSSPLPWIPFVPGPTRPTRERPARAGR